MNTDMQKIAKDILRRRGALHILGEPFFKTEVRFYTEESVLAALREALTRQQGERFKMPTDKQIVDIAILFSQEKGMVRKHELANILATCQFILRRLYDNNDVTIPYKNEND